MIHHPSIYPGGLLAVRPQWARQYECDVSHVETDPNTGDHDVIPTARTYGATPEEARRRAEIVARALTEAEARKGDALRPEAAR